MCNTKEDIERHNKAVVEERRAYHDRRCKESENYKRVCENMNKVAKYAHTLNNKLFFLEFLLYGKLADSPKIKKYEPFEFRDEDAPYYEEYFNVEREFLNRMK